MSLHLQKSLKTTLVEELGEQALELEQGEGEAHKVVERLCILCEAQMKKKKSVLSLFSSFF